MLTGAIPNMILLQNSAQRISFFIRVTVFKNV